MIAANQPQLQFARYRPESRSHFAIITRRERPSVQAARHIVIEGPIHVGKSTLAKALAEQLHARRILDADDNPFLTDFYEEKPGSAFRAQMYFLYERHRRLLDSGPQDNPAPIVSDFLSKTRSSPDLNLDNEELKLYERYFEMLAPSMPAPDLVICLQARGPKSCANASPRRADPAAKLEFLPEYVEAVSQCLRLRFSSAVPAQICSSSILRKLIS